MSGKWTKITATGKTESLETISAVMSMIDNGIMIEDYSDFSFSGMYGELVDEAILNADKETVKVSVFIPEERNLAECLAFVRERLATLKTDASVECDGVNEDDWAESWKKYYKPIPLGSITIVPAWEDYTAREGETVIRMDPGMAFGTGTHETTRLVIRLMQEVLSGGERVLDIGCGSGILSICARAIGAESCNAYDIDPVAVKVTRENVRDGGYDNIKADVSDLLLNVERLSGGYDVCFANIVADIIVRMLPDVRPYLKAGAPIILSGIIEGSYEQVRDKAIECGFSIVKEMRENDWVAMIIR